MPVAEDSTPSPPPQPVYTGFIAGLALFLLLLVAWSPQQGQHVARSVICQQVVGSPAAFVPNLPLNADAATDVARGVLPTTPGQASVALPLVQVASLPVSDGAVQLAVECRAASAAEALRFCSEAATRIVQSQVENWSPHEAQRRAQQSELQTRLALAREREHALLGEASQLEQEQIALAWREMQLARVAVEATAAAAAQQMTSTSQRQLAQRRLERQELLRSKTEIHPLVQQLNLQIAELQAQVEQERAAQPVEKPSADAATTELAMAQAELRHKFQVLADSRTELRGRIEQIEADLARLAVADPPLKLRTIISEPPSVLTKGNADLPWSRLLVLASIACTCGVAVTLAVRQQSRQQPFFSGDEVGRLLAMPVLTSDQAHGWFSERPTSLSERLRSGVLIAELVAFLLALTLTWSLATENEPAAPRGTSASTTTAAIAPEHQRR